MVDRVQSMPGIDSLDDEFRDFNWPSVALLNPEFNPDPSVTYVTNLELNQAAGDSLVHQGVSEHDENSLTSNFFVYLEQTSEQELYNAITDGSTTLTNLTNVIQPCTTLPCTTLPCTTQPGTTQPCTHLNISDTQLTLSHMVPSSVAAPTGNVAYFNNDSQTTVLHQTNFLFQPTSTITNSEEMDEPLVSRQPKETNCQFDANNVDLKHMSYENIHNECIDQTRYATCVDLTDDLSEDSQEEPSQIPVHVLELSDDCATKGVTSSPSSIGPLQRALCVDSTTTSVHQSPSTHSVSCCDSFVRSSSMTTYVTSHNEISSTADKRELLGRSQDSDDTNVSMFVHSGQGDNTCRRKRQLCDCSGVKVPDVDDERIERRKSQNRVAALRCRLKKKANMEQLYEKDRSLSEENVKLKSAVAQLQREVEFKEAILQNHLKTCSLTTSQASSSH